MKNSYTIIALKALLNGETMTRVEGAKNSNQYFDKIKHHGIELIEVWKPNLINRGKHKERRLNQSIENIKRAEIYLAKLQNRLFKV